MKQGEIKLIIKQMSQHPHFVNTKVNTKSLLGRSALIGQLQESKTLPPEIANSPFGSSDEKAQPNLSPLNFNNNIYNNFTSQHSIEQVSGAKRLLPKVDQLKVDMIKKLQMTGQIKSTGRSPVPLQLYDEQNPMDHLYITKVTKLVPVAHDQQIVSNSRLSKEKQQNTTTSISGMGSRVESGLSVLTSSKMQANKHLQNLLNQGFTITNEKTRNEMARSFDSTDAKKARQQESPRMIGQVSLKLPPGYELKQPTLQVNNTKAFLAEQSSFMQNLPTENTVHQNDSLLTVNNFNSVETIQTRFQRDSLFQETHHEQSMIQQKANSTHRSPILSTIPTKDEFYGSQGFRSAVRRTTHQEISEMLKVDHPHVYEEQRRQKEEKLRAISHPNKNNPHQDRKETFAAALRNNRWHAPVKKQQIYQNILDQTLEPQGKPIDMAIMAHQVIKFGNERDSGFQKLLQDQRARENKYGTGSIRKQTQAKILEIGAKKRIQEKQQQQFMQRNGTGSTSGFMNSLIEDSQEQTVRAQNTLGNLMQGMMGPGGTAQAPLYSSAFGEAPTQNPVGLPRKVSAIEAKHGVENKLRADFTNMLLGKKTQKLPTQIPMLKNLPLVGLMSGEKLPTSQEQTLSSIKLPQLITTRESGIGEEILRIKPNILAKRKAKKAMTGRKQSLALMATLHRSSNMSFNTAGKSGSQHPLGNNSSMVTLNNPVDNLEQIHLMLQQLEVIKQNKSRQGETKYATMPLNSPEPEVEFGSMASMAIINLPTGGKFHTNRFKKRNDLLQKKTMGRQRSKSKMSKGELLAPLSPQELEALYTHKPPQTTMSSTCLQEDSPFKAKQREDIEQTHRENNEVIRQIMKETAQMLQRPDTEAKYLRTHIIEPSELGKYSLRRFVGKTIQLNVGQLYQPLKFGFQEFQGKFTVYVSTKTKQPNEVNGFEQMITNQKKMVFPQQHENLLPNLLRFPKNKVLYITLESTMDCVVAITMTHNKKEAAVVKVASVLSSAENLESQSTSMAKFLVDSEGISPEDLEENARQTVETLKLMLGSGSEETMTNATKLYNMVKQKINYMINDDLDVAKDFLNLVDILKTHKATKNQDLKASILAKHPDVGIGASKNMDLAGGQSVVVCDGFQNLFQQDHYRRLKEGLISKQQYYEIRSQLNKSKREELDQMNRIRALESITRKDYRRELQERIIANLRKRENDQKLVVNWYKAFIIHKVVQNIKTAMARIKEEAKFMSKIFWIVFKIKIRMSRKIKKNGPTPEERARRQIKACLTSIGSRIHLREDAASQLILSTLQSLKMRQDIKKKIIDTGIQVRHIQERFRSYWQVRVEQINFITQMILRERDRLQIAMIKEKNSEVRQVGFYAGKVTLETVKKVALAYYRACQFTYEPIFFAWRNKCKEYQDQGLDDLTAGYHYPFMAPRGISSMEEIKYKLKYKSNSLKVFLEKASQHTRNRFRYYMNATEEENRSQQSVGSGSKRTVATSVGVRRSREKSQARVRSKIRARNPDYATLEEAIKKQEDQFKAVIITDLKNCAYYPTRPAMKFFPTPVMTHQLLHQAIMIQCPNFKAPEDWQKQYDRPDQNMDDIGDVKSSIEEGRERLTSTKTPFDVGQSDLEVIELQNKIEQLNPLDDAEANSEGILEITTRLISKGNEMLIEEAKDHLKPSRSVSRNGSNKQSGQSPRMSQELFDLPKFVETGDNVEFEFAIDH